MGLHAFVDESQGPPYRMAVVLVDAAAVRSVRSAARRWRHPGAPRFHASRDGDRVRSAAMRSLLTLPVDLVVVQLDRRISARGRRRLVVAEVARIAARAQAVRLILEDAEPERERDSAIIRRALGSERGPVPALAHMSASSEPILWIADLVAWAYSRGGKWRPRLPNVQLVRVP